jgi:hypothetical protein
MLLYLIQCVTHIGVRPINLIETMKKLCLYNQRTMNMSQRWTLLIPKIDLEWQHQNET